MDVAHQRGQRQVQLVVTAVDEDALGVEHGAHGAVRHQDAVFQRLTKFSRPGLRKSDTHNCVLLIRYRARQRLMGLEWL